VGAVYDAFSTAPRLGLHQLRPPSGRCAIARVLGLDAQQTQEALAMTWWPHYASDESISDLNAAGNDDVEAFQWAATPRAMRFRRVCPLGRRRGAVRPFVGKPRFIAKLANKREDAIACCASVCAWSIRSHASRRLYEALAGRSLAQSAIQAALQAREKVATLADQAGAGVCRGGAYDHLVRIRTDPWNPISRETADHSLPYIVAAAVLDGHVRTDSFNPVMYWSPHASIF